MLGKRQREFIMKHYCPPDSGYRLEVYYVDRYFNSRETGRGYPVMLAIRCEMLRGEDIAWTRSY